MVKTAGDASKFSFSCFFDPIFIVFYLFILSSLWGSPVGTAHRHRLCLDPVVVYIKGHSGAAGGTVVVPDVSSAAPAEWLSRKSLTAVGFLKNPSAGLHHRYLGLQKDWPKNAQYLAAECSVSGPYLIRHDSDYAAPGNCDPVHIHFNRHPDSIPDFQAPGVLPVLMTGGRLFGHLFHGLHDRSSLHRPQGLHQTQGQILLNRRAGWLGLPLEPVCRQHEPQQLLRPVYRMHQKLPQGQCGRFPETLWLRQKLKGYDEMFNVMIMLVVAVAFSIVMLGPWGFIKDAANVTESGQVIPFLIYLATIWSFALLVVPGLFVLVARAAGRLAGAKINSRLLTLRLAYILIPIGIFAWIAFSLPTIMVNYGYIISVFSDPLGLGWGLLGTAAKHFNPLLPDWIPVIQGVCAAGGPISGDEPRLSGAQRSAARHPDTNPGHASSGLVCSFGSEPVAETIYGLK